MQKYNFKKFFCEYIFILFYESKITFYFMYMRIYIRNIGSNKVQGPHLFKSKIKVS